MTRAGGPHEQTPSMLRTFLSFEQSALRWSRRLALAGGWTLLGIAVVTVADAVLRKFFSRPIQGTFEATELLLAVVVFSALPYAGLTDSHVSVDVLVRRCSPRVRSVVIAWAAAVCAALLGVITYQMGVLAFEFASTGRTTITARIPVLPFVVPAGVAAGLAALGFLIQALDALVRAVRSDIGHLSAGLERQ